MTIFVRLASQHFVSICFLLGLLLQLFNVSEAKAQLAELVNYSFQKVQILKRAGRYHEAIPHAKRTLELGKIEFGPDHKLIGTFLFNLAELHHAVKRYSEAETYYKQSLKNMEKTLGPEHPNVGTCLSSFAKLYIGQGRLSEAEPLLKRTIKIFEIVVGPNNITIATVLIDLAEIYKRQGQYSKALPIYKRSLSIRENALGMDHPQVADSITFLAELHRALGNYAKTELLLKRSLKIREKVLGPDHPDVAISLNNLAGLYKRNGRYDEAELIYKRSLEIREKKLGLNHSAVAVTINNLAALYIAQQRYSKAEPLLKRTIRIFEKKLGPDHVDLGTSLNNLAAFYMLQERFNKAAQLFKRTLDIYEKKLGPNHPKIGTGLSNLGTTYKAQGRYEEAEKLYKRNLKIKEKALGLEHSEIAVSLHHIADLYFAQNRWEQASENWQRAAGIITQRTYRDGQIGKKLTGKKVSDVTQYKSIFWGLLKSVYRENRKSSQTDDEMFQIAQWAKGSKAAASLSQMAARGATGNSELAKLVRERQDLLTEWQDRELAQNLIGLLSVEKKKEFQQEAKDNGLRLKATDKRIADIDAVLEADFPDYSAVTQPKPLSVEETQKLLGEKEAVVLFLDTPKWKTVPEETFIWVVTKDKSRWVRSALGTKALTDKVKKLRVGLDEFASRNDRGFTATTTGTKVQGLPFDLSDASELYQALFGKIEDLIADKTHLIIAPSGPLTALPFQVLVTKKPNVALPDFKGYAKADWLIKRQALTIMPSVASLKALRKHSRKGRQGKKSFYRLWQSVAVRSHGRRQIRFRTPELPDPQTETASREGQSRSE